MGHSGPAHAFGCCLCKNNLAGWTDKFHDAKGGGGELRTVLEQYQLSHSFDARLMLDAEGAFIPFTCPGCRRPTRRRTLARKLRTAYATAHFGTLHKHRPLIGASFGAVETACFSSRQI